MKILFLNPAFLDYRIPVYKELDLLASRSFRLIYSKERIPERCHKKIIENIGSNALPIFKEYQLKLGKINGSANIGMSIPFPIGLYKYLSFESPDIIISVGFFQWTPWAILRAKQLRIPIIIEYEPTEHTERNCPKWRRNYRKLVSRFIDGFISNGKLSKKYLTNLGVEANKIYTGTMAADSRGIMEECSKVKRERLDHIKRELNLNSGITYFFAGSFIERKGISQLIKAWKYHSQIYPDDNLIIAGTGVLEKTLKFESLDCHSIHYVGHVEYPNIATFYALSDVFVMPTLVDNWSLVVPEAMACGLPIACSIYNGCYPELVHEDINGHVFDPLDINNFVESLSYFHHRDLKQMGYNSKLIEQEYTPQKAAKKIYDACKSVTGKL